MRDAASFSLGELVYEYNTTLKSLLDSHAPMKTKTITLRPTAIWYTEELNAILFTGRTLTLLTILKLYLHTFTFTLHCSYLHYFYKQTGRALTLLTILTLYLHLHYIALLILTLFIHANRTSTYITYNIY